jgi:hypothetical protein
MIETHRHERRKAYDMGFDDSIALTTDEIREYTTETPGADDPVVAVASGFDGFTSSAQWANTVLPRLRDMAGYSGSFSAGTFHADMTECSERLDELVNSYRDGWVDKSLGYDRYSSRPHLTEVLE